MQQEIGTVADTTDNTTATTAPQSVASSSASSSDAQQQTRQPLPQTQSQSNVTRTSSKLQALAALGVTDESKSKQTQNTTAETTEQALDVGGMVFMDDADDDEPHNDDDDDDDDEHGAEEEKYPENNNNNTAAAQVRKLGPRSSTPMSVHSDDQLLTADGHAAAGTGAAPARSSHLMAQQSYSAQQDFEYACKRCVRPVRNNVFMEKTMEQCTVAEINAEIERLIACLHFLSDEFDIFHTLTGFLKSTESEFEEHGDMSSPFEFARRNGDDGDDDDDGADHERKMTHDDRKMTHAIYSQVSIKRVETSRHIQWLHMAYVTERTRLSEKKLDNRRSSKASKGPPDFENMTKKFSAKYEGLRGAFREIVNVLTEAHLRAHADEYSKPNGGAGAAGGGGGGPQDSVIRELKQKLKLQELANDAVLTATRASGGMHDSAAMIARLVTIDSGEAVEQEEEEAMAVYNDNRARYDPVFSCTPTDDEMQCYLSLSRAVFNDNIMSQILNVGTYGRVKDAFFLLRRSDRAIAQEVNGWVTTIDNILCVLLFRDPNAYRKRFVGELQLAMVVSGGSNDRLSTYENRVRLTVIKEAIRASFIGRPPDKDAEDNCFEVDDIVLRDKSSYSTNPCVCCKQCKGAPMVRLVFGIQCDAGKLDHASANTYNNSRMRRKFPYQFLYRSKRLFELIHRKKFAKVFNNDRELRRFARLEEVHEYDLSTFEYPKNEMDQQLFAHYVLMHPNTSLAAFGTASSNSRAMMNSHGAGTLPDLYDNATGGPQSMDDILYDAQQQNTQRGTIDIYGRANTVRRVQTVEQHFAHAFDTQNLVEVGADTILEEDFGIQFETRFVNWLNKVLNFWHPKIVYTRLTAEELEKKFGAEQKQATDAVPNETTELNEPNDENNNNGNGNVNANGMYLDVNGLPSCVDDMNRNVSNQSAEGVDALYDKLSDDEKFRKGHRFCCGYCFVSFGMVFFSVLMALIVGIGCWQIWRISEVPLDPTIHDLLSFTEQMIGAETEHLVQRALFSTNQFIEFVQVLPQLTQNKTLFTSFLSDDLMASPRYDGIIQLRIPWGDNDSEIESSFVFKTSQNEPNAYQCTLSWSADGDIIDDADCHADINAIASELLGHYMDGLNHTQIHTFFLSDAIIDGDEYADQGHLWFVTWRALEIEEASVTRILAGMFRSSRISREYQKWPIARDGCVYWVTHDDYRDVFVTSLPDEPLYISEHGDAVSSIKLNSNFGFARDDAYTSMAVQVDDRILHTLDRATDALNQSIEEDGYFIYTSLQHASFGSFYVVVVFPQDNVYRVKRTCETIALVVTLLAMLLAFVNACLANAIPLIPADDSWLAVPYFTDQDKEALEDYEEEDDLIDGRATTLSSGSSPSKAKQRRGSRMKNRRKRSLKKFLKKGKRESAASGGAPEDYKPITLSVSPMSPKNHSEQTLIANINISQPLPEDKADDDVLARMNRRQRSNSADGDPHQRTDSKTLTGNKLAALSTEMVPVKTKGKGKRAAALSMPGPYRDEPIQHASTGGFSEKKFKHQNTESRSSFHIDDDEEDDRAGDFDDEEDARKPATAAPSRSSQQLLGRDLPKRAVSVNTAQMQHLSPHSSAMEEFQQQRKKQERQKRKEKRRRLLLYKKKQQRLQLQRNINHANMRSIFARETDSHRTKYGKRMNTVIHGMCTTVALLVCGLYLLLRVLTGDDLEALMNAHLQISGYIVETHAEFKVYQHGLALQQGELLIASPEFGDTANPDLLYSFYNMFDDLAGVFTFRGTSSLNPYSNVEEHQLSNFSIFGNAALDPTSGDDEQCLKMRQIEDSYLATCIQWDLCDNNNETEYEPLVTANVTDCTLYRAIQETFVYFSEHADVAEHKRNFIGFSIPFACFGGQKICYVGLTRLSSRFFDNASPMTSLGDEKRDLFVGALLSMHLLADVAEDVIWHKSGMSDVVARREQQQPTAYKNIQVQFSFYLYVSLVNLNDTRTSAGYFADHYGVDGDYLLATSGNEVITTTQTSYGVPINSILRANESKNEIVQRTYAYLLATNSTIEAGEPLIVPQTWSYPIMVFYRYVHDAGLNWVSVVTIDLEIFMGDHLVYVSVGSLSVFGWFIIYLFFHYVSHRRFQENISYWETLYEAQLQREMFPIWNESENDEEEDNNNNKDKDKKALKAAPEQESISLVNAPAGKHGYQNSLQESPTPPPAPQQQPQPQPGQNKTWDAIEEQATLNFISENIRDTVRKACQQDWIRQQTEDTADLPVNRRDVTDHYHKRALLHIHQAKRGMNIITVVQMEQYGQGGAHRLIWYRLQSSYSWKFIIQAFMIMHCLLVFWRPLTDLELEQGYDTAPFALELVCLAFECIDLMLTFCIQFQWQDTSKNPLMSPSQQRGIFWARVLIWAAIVVDVILIRFSQRSFTRIFPIRPLLLILSTDKLVGACYALAITSFEALDVLLLAAILLVIGAIVGVILFRFDALMGYYNIYSFHNMVRSLFSTYVFIISGENYGEVVYDAFHASFLYMGFFVVLTVLGSWIVISLVVSRFQTSFKQIYGRERQRRIYFKRTGYVAAFSLINLDDDNQVSKEEFESFVRYLKNQNTTQRRRSGKQHLGDDEAEVAQELLKELKWDEVDVDGSDSIDIREFVTALEEIYQKPALINIINDDDSLSAWIRLNIVETEAFSQFVLVIILIEISVFCFFGLYPGTRNMEMLDTLLGVTTMLNALDIIVKMVSLGWPYYWNTSKCRVINRHKTVLSKTDDPNSNNYSIAKQRLLKQQQQQKQNRAMSRHQHTGSGMPILANLDIAGPLEEDRSAEIQALSGMHEQHDSLSLNGLAPNMMFGAAADDEDEYEYEESVYTQNPLTLKEREFAHRFDLTIVALAVLSFVITRAAVNAFSFDDRTNIWRIVMVLPLFRLFTLIKTTRSAVYIIVKVIPRFGWLFLILLILFYMYAVFGVWLIGDALDTRLLDPPQYSFSTFHGSLVTLFQLTVGEGWHNVMYDTVYAKSSLLVTTPYFVSFVLIITLIFTNLFVGLVISVVDDVNQDNKNMAGQLQDEYLQQQWEETVNEKSEENNTQKKETRKRTEHVASGTMTNDELPTSPAMFNNRSATHRNLGSNYLSNGATKANVFSPNKRGSAMWSSKLYL